MPFPTVPTEVYDTVNTSSVFAALKLATFESIEAVKLALKVESVIILSGSPFSTVMLEPRFTVKGTDTERGEASGIVVIVDRSSDTDKAVILDSCPNRYQ